VNSGRGEGLWSRFLAHAAHARAKPTFDAEEREFRKSVAERVRAALDGAEAGSDWLTTFEALAAPVRWETGAPENFANWTQYRWLMDWARSDVESLRFALSEFRAGDIDPPTRFARFVERAGSWDETGAAARPAALLAVGSRLNFALDPSALPVVRRKAFRQLERTLGVGTPPADDLTAEYRWHLSFADSLKERFQAAGIPIRDMIDVESLMLIANQQRVLWEQDDSPAAAGTHAPETSTPETYLAACAIYRDEGPYLREWVEFHRLVGIERFFLYDNGSSDDHLEVLGPYLACGMVELRPWQGLPTQHDAYDDCLERQRSRCRWIAFLDLDEFVFSPTGEPLPEILTDYEQWPGVAINWAMFGPSGHRTKPDGLVIENYLQRIDTPVNRHVKSIVDPRRALACRTAHSFDYDRGLAIDENHYPLTGGRTNSVSFARLRVNHYYTKSEEEFARKLGQRRADTGAVRTSLLDCADCTEQHDETITAYLPALRAAIEAVESGRELPAV
jgi:hypothetical protein